MTTNHHTDMTDTAVMRDTVGHLASARRPARKLRLVAAAAPVLLLAVGCIGETYVVRQVNGTTVICGEKNAPEKTLTREWDPIAQIAPEVGQEWLCNE